MKSIEEKVKEICAEQFPDFSYVFESWYEADKVISRLKSLPAIICVLPVSGTLEEHINTGRMKDAENTAIAFVDKVRRDANGFDNYTAYNSMKKSAKKFIKAVNKDQYFKPLSGRQSYEVIYEQYSTIVTGIYLDLNLEQAEGVCDDEQ